MKPSTERVLDLLRAGPVTTGQFAAAFCPRASARILELRNAGYSISTRQLGASKFLYTLEYEPATEEPKPEPPTFSTPPVDAQEIDGTLFAPVDIDIPKPKPAGPYEVAA